MRQTVQSLLRCPEAAESELYVYSDGPKTPDKAQAVAENRAYIHTITGFRAVHIVERDHNMGLAASLIDGITNLTDRYGRVIVVEDDLVVAPTFLTWLNTMLDRYEDDDRVSAIAAHTSVAAQGDSPFFLRFFECWGWATWRRGWQLFNPDTRTLLRQMRWRTHDFNVGGYGGFYGMLYCQKVGLVDSWAVRYYASSFLAGKVVLYPPHTLVHNIGLDGTGTHWGAPAPKHHAIAPDAGRFNKCTWQAPDTPPQETAEMRRAYERHFQGKRHWWQPHVAWPRMKSFTRRLIGLDHR